MIKSISVSNYALINEIQIDFSSGLTIITGETGAGKSILIGALSLLLGNRADISILRDKNKKCLVEAEFISEHPDLPALFNENGIENDNSIILRREIAANGKSRAFINDTPVSTKILKDAGTLLVDIHSQHENLNLNDNLYQLSVVDTYADLSSMLQEYKGLYTRYRSVENELAVLRENSARILAELDFLSFQYNELNDAKLLPDEQEELESELQVLNHSGEIKAGLFSAWQFLAGDITGSDNQLRSAEQSLSKIEKFHEPSLSLRERIESSRIELKDIARELEILAEKTQNDPSRLETVRNRIDLLYSLQQKHRVKSLEDLINLRDSLKLKIDDLSSQEFRMDGLEKERSVLHEKIIEFAGNISVKRTTVFSDIQDKIVSMLLQLGMPNARFGIENRPEAEPGPDGIDNIRFLFTANRKTEMQDISKVASGGELSRLMLSIKSLVSGMNDLPVIIFDEIDQGVSGEIAFKVGKILKDMSGARQIFAITHLPQVASKGDYHFLVYKSELESGTTTEIRLLDKEERLTEIAKMLSGEQTTEAAFANARELLRI